MAIIPHRFKPFSRHQRTFFLSIAVQLQLKSKRHKMSLENWASIEKATIPYNSNKKSDPAQKNL